MTSMDWLQKIDDLFRSKEYAQAETLAAGSYPLCSNPRGIPVKWRRNRGEGHWYPAEFHKSLNRGLAFILGGTGDAG
jgi:hypothetical protein